MRVPLNRNVIGSRFNWQRVVLLALFALAAFSVVVFGVRSYRSFLLLHSAYELGAPDVARLRAWMTLDYVARIYRVSGTELTDGVGLSSNEDPKTTLRPLAECQGVSLFRTSSKLRRRSRGYVPSHCLQAGAMSSASRTHSATAFLPRCCLRLSHARSDAHVRCCGRAFPLALSVVVAGSLAAQGQMSLLWAGAVAVAFSVLGDLAGYGLGTLLGVEFFERRGRWLGLTPALRAKVEIFSRNGAL